MNYGEKFCNLAFEALRDEEAELLKSASNNPAARPLSVIAIGEPSVAYLIIKKALRDPGYPYLINEWPYVDGSKKADFCFSDRPTNRALASFELKVATLQYGWVELLADVRKHLDLTKKINGACDTLERYCVVILATDEDNSKEASEAFVNKKIRDLIPSPAFFTSPSIKLNHLEATNPTAQAQADLLKYLRVIVFTGEYVVSAQSASAGNPHAS